MNAVRSPAVCLFSIIVISSALWPPNIWAEGINFRSEFTYRDSDTKTTNKVTGEVTESEYSAFRQWYNLDLFRTIYPYLTLRGGSILELNDSMSSSQDTETKTEEQTLRPFAEINLNNPIYKAGIGYRGTQIERDTTGIPTTKDLRDEFSTLFGWRPTDFPEMNVRYTHTHTYDHPETVDTIDKLLTYDARYTAWEELRMSYLYIRNERQELIDPSETLRQTHTGRVDYSHSFFGKRLSMGTGYRIRHDTLEFPTLATLESPVLRSVGLSALDDTPTDGPALDPNLGLIDGDVATSAGLDIGLAGDETTLTNLGLDFGFPVSMDKLYVWVSRRLSSSVSNAFSWSVYTSPDNTDVSTWSLVATVSPASFGALDNRFEISVPAVNTRFIKLAVRPLSPIVPDAANFSNIFITEIQAFSTQSGVSLQTKDTTVDHDYNFNLTGRLSTHTVLGYNLYYSLQERDPSAEKRTRLSNDIFLKHTFNEIFSASTSVSQTDTKLTDQETHTYTYAASLNADHLDTFGQTLTYSGTDETQDNDSGDTNSVFLRNNAKLYKGWSAFFDVGYSWNKPLNSARTTSTIIRSGTDIEPNEKLNINMNYSVTDTKQAEEDGRDTSRSSLDLQAFFLPCTTLSLFARLSVQDRGGSRTTLQDYSVSWSPFPDGTLQFLLGYTETLRPEDEQKDRTISPSLKWTIGRHILADMSYTIATSETELQTIDSNSLNINVKLIF